MARPASSLAASVLLITASMGLASNAAADGGAYTDRLRGAAAAIRGFTRNASGSDVARRLAYSVQVEHTFVIDGTTRDVDASMTIAYQPLDQTLSYGWEAFIYPNNILNYSALNIVDDSGRILNHTTDSADGYTRTRFDFYQQISSGSLYRVMINYRIHNGLCREASDGKEWFPIPWADLRSVQVSSTTYRVTLQNFGALNVQDVCLRARWGDTCGSAWGLSSSTNGEFTTSLTGAQRFDWTPLSQSALQSCASLQPQAAASEDEGGEPWYEMPWYEWPFVVLTFLCIAADVCAKICCVCRYVCACIDWCCGFKSEEES